MTKWYDVPLRRKSRRRTLRPVSLLNRQTCTKARYPCSRKVSRPCVALSAPSGSRCRWSSVPRSPFPFITRAGWSHRGHRAHRQRLALGQCEDHGDECQRRHEERRHRCRRRLHGHPRGRRHLHSVRCSGRLSSGLAAECSSPRINGGGLHTRSLAPRCALCPRSDHPARVMKRERRARYR